MSTSFQGALASSGHTGLLSGLRRPVSQEQSISNQIRKLTSSFDALLNLHEKSPVTKEKITAVFARLDRLGLGDKDEHTNDPRDSARRADLFIVLNRIKDELRVVLGRIEAAGPAGNDKDVQVVSELVDDIRDAVIDYQMAHQQAVYDQNLQLIDRADMVVLNSCRRAHGAGYRHGGRGGCLKGTRGSVLAEIERWTEDFDRPPVFWLNGLAGTGKSTLAQTAAERVFANGLLGASFFCSRGVEDRSDLQLIFPTLAFQLAQTYQDFRTALIPLLQSNPDIVHESLQDQVQRLIVQPLRSANVSTVIVIDALDECKDEDPESAILLVLGKVVSGIPKVKFFITSRPEAHISSGFRGSLLKNSTHVFILHDVEPRTIDDDIRRFFKLELSGLAYKQRVMEGWPTNEHLDSLCRRAAGFFVYAVATVNFLKHRFKRPSDRLDIIMQSPESTVHEGKAELKAYTSLDSLYMSILQEAFRKNDAEDDAMVRSVLSAVVLVVNPLSLSTIATLMGLDCDVVLSLLESIQSLLALHDDINHPIHPFHKSFPDFIIDPTRCLDKRFYICPDYHTELVLRCLKLMDESLEKNMCSIPDYALNSQVDGLSERIDGSEIRGALEYACRSWDKHLLAIRDHVVDVVFVLRGFLERKFLFWLEVLSVLGAVGDAARALEATAKWLTEIQGSIDVGPLLDTVADYLRFVTEFFDIIRQSVPHIYHSALPLAPLSSVVRNRYSQQTCSSMSKVITGIPVSWDSCTASIGDAAELSHPVWSPCGQSIATCFGHAIQIRDSNTLERISVLSPPSRRMKSHHKFLAFSPDGRLLACVYRKRKLRSPVVVFVWDIQTGVIINDVKHWESDELVIFGNHRTATLLGRDGSFRTYDGPSGTCMYKDKLEQPLEFLLGAHWVHEERLRFPTISRNDEKLVVSIQELQPVATPPLLLIESFSIPPHDGELSFSPVSFHASFVTKTEIIVLNVRDSRILLEVETTCSPYNPPGHFSPDGCFFACRTEEFDICIWKNTPANYVPWSNLRPRLPFKGFSFSPTKSTILTWGPGGIQLLEHGNRPIVPPSDQLAPNLRRRGYLVAYFADGTHIAMVRRGDCVVTILDSLSNSPRQFFDANIPILDIKIADNTIFAVGRCEVVRWYLEEGRIVCGSRSVIRVADQTVAIADPTLSDDCLHIAFTHGNEVYLYDVQAQKILRSHTAHGRVADTRFSPDGRQLLFICGSHGSLFVYSVELEKGKDGNATTKVLSNGWSWVNLFSPHGWLVGGESEWVEDSRGKKLLWLPVSWRTKKWSGVRWDGDFLALVCGHHPEPIVIEFQP